jgi:hypothetical protein
MQETVMEEALFWSSVNLKRILKLDRRFAERDIGARVGRRRQERGL